MSKAQYVGQIDGETYQDFYVRMWEGDCFHVVATITLQDGQDNRWLLAEWVGKINEGLPDTFWLDWGNVKTEEGKWIQQVRCFEDPTKPRELAYKHINFFMDIGLPPSIGYFTVDVPGHGKQWFAGWREYPGTIEEYEHVIALRKAELVALRVELAKLKSEQRSG